MILGGHFSFETLKTKTKGAENIINGLNEITNIQMAIFTLSLLVCKNGYILKNETEFCPPNYYGKSKMIGEYLVRNMLPSRMVSLLI